MSQSQLEALWKLHEIDQEILQIRADSAAEAAGLLREAERIESSEKELAEIHGQIKVLQMDLDRRQLALESAEEAKARLENQVSELKTNEDFAAMQKQIAAKNEEISGLEDGILESMEVVETAKPQLSKREEALEERRKELVLAKARVAEKQAELEIEIAKKQARWDQIAETLDAGWVATYRDVRDRRDGKGMARIGADRMCQGCFMSLATQILNRAMAASFVQCPKCERILIYS